MSEGNAMCGDGMRYKAQKYYKIISTDIVRRCKHGQQYRNVSHIKSWWLNRAQIANNEQENVSGIRSLRNFDRRLPLRYKICHWNKRRFEDMTLREPQVGLFLKHIMLSRLQGWSKKFSCSTTHMMDSTKWVGAEGAHWVIHSTNGELQTDHTINLWSLRLGQRRYSLSLFFVSDPKTSNLY